MAKYRKFWVAFTGAAAIVVTTIWGDAWGAKIQEILTHAEAILTALGVWAVPNS